MPALPWRYLLGSAALAFMVFTAAMEWALAARGIRADLPDDAWLWSQQRARADRLGSQALILVGASRMQTDLDLDTLRRATGLEPVQLAVDGSSFLPVLADLASDPAVTGTVLVDFNEAALAAPPRPDAAGDFVTAYRRARRSPAWPDFERSEAGLTALVHGRLRSFADGATPWDSLQRRVLARHPRPQYVAILPDRSRLADFSLVDPAVLYYQRVMRELGGSMALPAGISYAQLDASVQQRIEALSAVSPETFRAQAPALLGQIHAIQGRGGRVIVVALPRSGAIEEIEQKRFPRALYFNPFVAAAGVPAVHFEDVAALRGLHCPDGSHLDYRDRGVFTRVLARALQAAAGGLAGGAQ